MTKNTKVKTILVSPEFEYLKNEFMNNHSQATSYAKGIIRSITQISGEELDTNFFKHPLLRRLYREVVTNASPALSGLEWELKKFLTGFGCDLTDSFFSKANLDENELDHLLAPTSNRIKAKIINKMNELNRDNYPFSRVELLSTLSQEFPNAEESEISNAIAVFLKDPAVTKMSYGKYVFKNHNKSELSKEFVLDTILEAIKKIKTAEITCIEEREITEIKQIIYTAVTAEQKLQLMLEELNALFEENETDIVTLQSN